MKQICKKLSGLFLALACMLSLFSIPVHGAVNENLESELKESFQYLVVLMSNFSEESMKDQLEGLDNPFLDSMAEKYYDTVEKAGAFKEVLDSNVVIDEENETAVVTLKVAFEDYTGNITANCNYTATDANEAWSGFDVKIEYPISALLRNADTTTLIGIGIALIVLICLAFVILRKKHVQKTDVRNDEKAEPDIIPTSPESLPEPVMEASENIEEVELAIVLAAAIAAYEEENPGGDGYVARSIRKNHNRRWRRA